VVIHGEHVAVRHLEPRQGEWYMPWTPTTWNLPESIQEGHCWDSRLVFYAGG